MDGTILIADDDRTIRTVLTQAFVRAGCKVHATSSLTTLMRWVNEGLGDLAISDVIMPDGNGLEMVPKIRDLRPDLPVIVISAQNTIMTTIKATEAKAFDYLPKPFDLPDLMNRSATALKQSKVQNRQTKAIKTEDADLPLVGRSDVMQNLYRMLAKLAQTDIAVLISGPSGAGKSLTARIIHDFSKRRDMAFVVVSAAELNANEHIEQLFERARGGTIVLDEISDLDLETQGMVSQHIDRMPADFVRLISTSQVDLTQKMQTGSFRQDLFYRLNGIALTMPPLLMRSEDIGLLVEHFLQKIPGGAGKSVSEEGLAILRAYTWPGNLRQLENCLTQLVISAAAAQISEKEIMLCLAGQPGNTGAENSEMDASLSDAIGRHLQRYFDLHGQALPPAGLYGRILHELEQPLLQISLDATSGNQIKCAEMLGINRNTLRKKLNGLDIHVTRRRKLM